MTAVRAILFCLSIPAAFGQATPEALLKAGHIKRARAIIEEKYRQTPNDPEVLWLMSWVRQDFKDVKASIDFAEKALAANPKEARYHQRVAEAVGEEAQHASALRQMGLGRRFKKEIDATLALDPKNVEALKYLMEFYFAAPGLLGGDKAKGHTTADQIL